MNLVNVCFIPSFDRGAYRDYARLGCSPLLFVSSDSPRSDISTAQLFPERVLNQLGINSIQLVRLCTCLITACSF